MLWRKSKSMGVGVEGAVQGVSELAVHMPWGEASRQRDEQVPKP